MNWASLKTCLRKTGGNIRLAAAGLLVLGLLLAGGKEPAKTTGHTGWTDFALTSAFDYADWLKLQAGLHAEGIVCRVGAVDLGCVQIKVEAGDFARAQEIAVWLITRNALTVRLRADAVSDDYCVWESGRKKCYENYWGKSAS